MNHLEEARLLAALLGVLKKEKSSLREELLKEIHSELGNIELPEPVLVEGPQGPQGEQGPQGPRGFLGEQGPQGEIGPVGEKGDQGLPGKTIIEAQLNDSGNLYLYRDDGVQFPIGNVIGEQGPVGPIGPKGDKGDKGDQGIPGEQGPQGDIGPQGDRGLSGLQGRRGEKGEKGDSGEQGLPGVKGDQGDVGPIGPKGDRGDIGLQGIQGEKGPKGDKGDPGPQGEKGDPGKDGESPDIEPYLKKVTEEQKKFQDNIRRTITRASMGGSSSGGGEVRLEFLDDVDRNSAKQNGKVLRFNSSTGKFEGATVLTEGGAGSGDVANTYLQATFVSNTNFQSFVANTNPRFDQYLQVANNKTIVAGNNIVISQNSVAIEISSTASGGGGGTDLTAVTTNIVPSSNNTLDLGTSEKRWRDLFLSGQTINLGGATISSDGTGQISISGTGAVLPANSRVSISNQQKTIATIGENGSAERLVPLFTQATGLTAPANTFSFRTETNTKVFTRFFLNSGAQIDADAAAAQFLF